MSALGSALLLLGVASRLALAQTGPRVSLAQGDLLGSWMKTRDGHDVAAFRAIPYAKPPIKELRFKGPQPPEPWRGVRCAQDDGPQCMQFSSTFGIQGQEDCLNLNVYSRKMSCDKKLPVLFFIHGGSFTSGSGVMFGPKYLLDEYVVLVTVNYRLGAFGFLCTDDTIIPGNFGLKDQRAALRWVQDNIEHFCGDPMAITIFGESAGAISVHYHMMYNKHKFKAAILQSGTGLAGVSLQRPGDQKPLIRHILNKTGCPEGDSNAILDCLQKVPASNLTTIVSSFSPPYESLLKTLELRPVMEADCVEDAFITGDPWDKTTSTPMIIGTNQCEGNFVMEDLLKDETNEKFNRFNQEYKKILPINLMYDPSAKDPQSVSDQLRYFYFKENEIKREYASKLDDMYSDGWFNHGAASAAKNNTAATFLYSFNYLGSYSAMNLLGYRNSCCPTHADELWHFFDMPDVLKMLAQRGVNKTEEDLKMSKELIKMWANFATHMTPVPEGSDVSWEPVSGDDLRYLNINGPGNMTMESGFYRERVAFWDNLPFRNKPMIDINKCCVQGWRDRFLALMQSPKLPPFLFNHSSPRLPHIPSLPSIKG